MEPSIVEPEGTNGEVPAQATAALAATDVPTNGLSGSVLIDEVLYDPPVPLPDPDGEWLVLRNVTNVLITLRGWTLRDGNATSNLPTIDLPAGTRLLVLAAEADGVQQFSGDVLRVALDGRIGNGLRNAGDAVWLVDGSGTPIDAVSWGDDTSAFAPAVPLVEGRSIKRTRTQDTDSAQDWSEDNLVKPVPDAPTPFPQPVVPADPSPTDLPSGALSDAPQVPPQATVLVPSQPTGNAVAATVVPGSPPAVRVGIVGGASLGNLVISEVAPGEGWVELYNRGPEVVDVSDWTLADESRSPGVVLQSAALLPAHGFIVFDVPELNMTTVNQRITLRRPDGMIADSIMVGPAPAQRSWSRYPVHGGVWTANTPMSRGQFNQPGPTPRATTAVPVPTPEPSPTAPAVVQDSIIGSWISVPSMVLWVSSMVVAFFMWRRRRR